MEYKKIVECIITRRVDEFDVASLLESYVLFLVSNPDFKYNQTYFTDGFGDFEKSIKLLHDRANIFKKVTERLLEKQKKSLLIESSVIIFDSIYKYTLTDKIEAEIISDNSDFRLYDYYNQSVKLECVIKYKKDAIRNFAYIIDKKMTGKDLIKAISDAFEKNIDSTK